MGIQVPRKEIFQEIVLYPFKVFKGIPSLIVKGGRGTPIENPTIRFCFQCFLVVFTAFLAFLSVVVFLLALIPSGIFYQKAVNRYLCFANMIETEKERLLKESEFPPPSPEIERYTNNLQNVFKEKLGFLPQKNRQDLEQKVHTLLQLRKDREAIESKISTWSGQISPSNSRKIARMKQSLSRSQPSSTNKGKVNPLAWVFEHPADLRRLLLDKLKVGKKLQNTVQIAYERWNRANSLIDLDRSILPLENSLITELKHSLQELRDLPTPNTTVCVVSEFSSVSLDTLQQNIQRIVTNQQQPKTKRKSLLEIEEFLESPCPLLQTTQHLEQAYEKAQTESRNTQTSIANLSPLKQESASSPEKVLEMAKLQQTLLALQKSEAKAKSRLDAHLTQSHTNQQQRMQCQQASDQFKSFLRDINTVFDTVSWDFSEPTNPSMRTQTLQDLSLLIKSIEDTALFEPTLLVSFLHSAYDWISLPQLSEHTFHQLYAQDPDLITSHSKCLFTYEKLLQQRHKAENLLLSSFKQLMSQSLQSSFGKMQFSEPFSLLVKELQNMKVTANPGQFISSFPWFGDEKTNPPPRDGEGETTIELSSYVKASILREGYACITHVQKCMEENSLFDNQPESLVQIAQIEKQLSELLQEKNAFMNTVPPETQPRWRKNIQKLLVQLNIKKHFSLFFSPHKVGILGSSLASFPMSAKDVYGLSPPEKTRASSWMNAVDWMKNDLEGLKDIAHIPQNSELLIPLLDLISFSEKASFFDEEYYIACSDLLSTLTTEKDLSSFIDLFKNFQTQVDTLRQKYKTLLEKTSLLFMDGWDNPRYTVTPPFVEQFFCIYDFLPPKEGGHNLDLSEQRSFVEKALSVFAVIHQHTHTAPQLALNNTWMKETSQTLLLCGGIPEGGLETMNRGSPPPPPIWKWAESTLSVFKAINAYEISLQECQKIHGSQEKVTCNSQERVKGVAQLLLSESSLRGTKKDISQEQEPKIPNWELVMNDLKHQEACRHTFLQLEQALLSLLDLSNQEGILVSKRDHAKQIELQSAGKHMGHYLIHDLIFEQVFKHLYGNWTYDRKFRFLGVLCLEMLELPFPHEQKTRSLEGPPLPPSFEPWLHNNEHTSEEPPLTPSLNLGTHMLPLLANMKTSPPKMSGQTRAIKDFLENLVKLDLIKEQTTTFLEQYSEILPSKPKALDEIESQLRNAMLLNIQNTALLASLSTEQQTTLESYRGEPSHATLSSCKKQILDLLKRFNAIRRYYEIGKLTGGTVTEPIETSFDRIWTLSMQQLEELYNHTKSLHEENENRYMLNTKEKEILNLLYKHVLPAVKKIKKCIGSDTSQDTQQNYDPYTFAMHADFANTDYVQKALSAITQYGKENENDLEGSSTPSCKPPPFPILSKGLSSYLNFAQALHKVGYEEKSDPCHTQNNFLETLGVLLRLQDQTKQNPQQKEYSDAFSAYLLQVSKDSWKWVHCPEVLLQCNIFAPKDLEAVDSDLQAYLQNEFSPDSEDKSPTLLTEFLQNIPFDEHQNLQKFFKDFQNLVAKGWKCIRK